MKDPVGHDGDRFVKELPERFNELGSFIREQRSSARLSLRRLSELAGISNPYLSQIERGLRRPSAEILQQIAKALRISAETLYVQAGHPRAARPATPTCRGTSSPTSTSPRSSARRSCGSTCRSATRTRTWPIRCRPTPAPVTAEARRPRGGRPTMATRPRPPADARPPGRIDAA